jgi:ElaB/YqjD/DUF883 family membrane-anchored ribosome-binding protein
LREKASEVGQNIRETGKELGAKAQTIKERASEMGQEAGQYAKEKFDQMRESAGEYYEEGREKAMQWKGNLESYIQDQPVRAVLIASGIGLLIGLLLKRSRA